MNSIANVIQESSKIVSPAWPLKSFVAVNPFWNLKEQSFYSVLPKLTQMYGKSLFLPLSAFVEKYDQGLIKKSNLTQAMELIKDFGIVLEDDFSLFMRESCEAQEQGLGYLTYSDFVSNTQNNDAKDHVVCEISKFCSSYFDLGQAPFSLKNSSKRLYLEWQSLILFDRSFELLGYKKENSPFDFIPDDPLQLIEQCSMSLGILTPQDLGLYIMKICHHMMGWCSHIYFNEWQENFDLNKKNKGTKIDDIIAMYLYYECMVKNTKNGLDEKWNSFYKRQNMIFSSKQMALDHNFKLLCVWQRAFELSYQEKIAQNILHHGFSQGLSQIKKSVQMVFCIDVRSEVMRRKIEENLPQVSTHGFAGFFGVPLQCSHGDHDKETYHCPVLLSPKIKTREKFTKKFEMETQGKNSLESFLSGLKQGLVSSFAYVEFFGILSGYKILAKTKSHKHNLQKLIRQKFMKPSTLDNGLSDAEKLETAHFFLTHINLRDFADIIIICAHGSLSTNNAFASSLDCGACGGHSGDLNARFLCQILNDHKVRQGIAQKGKFKIPQSTQFIPALHETVSDEIQFLDSPHFSREIINTLAQLKHGFSQASKEAQKERSCISKNTPASAVERSTNWAEVRPDWALVKNACLIIAPRERTLNINLEGRAFLHDYHHKDDKDLKTLELIMTAPMVVTHWINMQYYASSVCPDTYGSGNKVLHNINGLLGVLEGNAGDLKIGLPFQSLHDGTHLIHDPLRLSVFIEAPCADVEHVIQTHSVVHNLVENQWLHIFTIDPQNKKIRLRRSQNTYDVMV